MARKTVGPRRVTWQRQQTGAVLTTYVQQDTGALPVMQRTRRVPSWTMWLAFTAAAVLCVAGGAAWLELSRLW